MSDLLEIFRIKSFIVLIGFWRPGLFFFSRNQCEKLRSFVSEIPKKIETALFWNPPIPKWSTRVYCLLRVDQESTRMMLTRSQQSEIAQKSTGWCWPGVNRSMLNNGQRAHVLNVIGNDASIIIGTYSGGGNLRPGGELPGREIHKIRKTLKDI